MIGINLPYLSWSMPQGFIKHCSWYHGTNSHKLFLVIKLWAIWVSKMVNNYMRWSWSSRVSRDDWMTGYLTGSLPVKSTLYYDIHVFLVLVIHASLSRCMCIYTANKHRIARGIYIIMLQGLTWTSDTSLLPVWCYSLYLSHSLQVPFGVQQKFALLLKRSWLYITS